MEQSAEPGAKLNFPAPTGMGLRLGKAILLHHRLDFGVEARRYLAGLDPPLVVLGADNIPQGGPAVITMNHLYMPGYQAWWQAAAISSLTPAPIHWVMAAAWTSTNPWVAWWKTPLTYWIFQKIADTYGFTTMPPMPPDPRQVEWRARSVRKVLAYARRPYGSPDGQPLIGLAPEGGDMPGGVIGMPPTGVGRFIALLAGMRLAIIPVATFVEENRLCLRFGKAYQLQMPSGGDRDRIDIVVSRQVMSQIAAVAPPALRGEFVVETALELDYNSIL